MPPLSPLRALTKQQPSSAPATRGQQASASLAPALATAASGAAGVRNAGAGKAPIEEVEKWLREVALNHAIPMARIENGLKAYR